MKYQPTIKVHNKKIDLCSGPIMKNMLLFTLPLICSSVLQLLFNAADMIVVGQFEGDTALAAVGSNGSLINLLTNLFLGLAIGANVLAAKLRGAGDDKGLKKTVQTAMLLSVICGVILTIIGLLFTKDILIMMSTPNEVLNLAAVYLKIYFLGVTSTIVYNFGSALLRAIGDTKRSLIFLMISGVINVALNLVFVIVLKMGVSGVAVATVISQTIAAVLVVICLLKEKSPIRLVLRDIRIDGDKLKSIIFIGLPAGIQSSLFSFSNVIIQSSINIFGENVVAGAAASANIEGFIYVSMNAFAQTTISYVGQNYGAGNFKRIDKIFICAIFCTSATGIILSGLTLLFGRSLLQIYVSGQEAIDAGLIRMLLICSLYFICGVMDVSVSVIRSLGTSILPMLVSLVGACGLRLLIIATIFQIPQFHNISTVFATYPISWVITFSGHLICFFILRKKIYPKTINEIDKIKAA